MFGQYGPDFPSESGALFERHLEVLAEDLGLPSG